MESEREERKRATVGRVTEGKQDKKARESTLSQGDIDGLIHWQIYYKLCGKYLKFHSKRLGYPLVGAQRKSGPFGVVGVWWSCGGLP